MKSYFASFTLYRQSGMQVLDFRLPVSASPSDSSDVERFGYRQELERSLGAFSAFAAGFSYISILTGIFQMFYLGYGAGGPAFFWRFHCENRIAQT
jgi:hypothetical protein